MYNAENRLDEAESVNTEHDVVKSEAMEEWAICTEIYGGFSKWRTGEATKTGEIWVASEA